MPSVNPHFPADPAEHRHDRPSARLADLRGHRRGDRRSRRRTWPPGAARVRQRQQGRPDPAAASGRPGIDRAIGSRAGGPILLSSRGTQMDRHAATRRLRRLAAAAGVPITRPHPHMLRHTFVTTMLTPERTCGTSRSPPATPAREPQCATTGPARTPTATPTTSWPPGWPQEPDPPTSPAAQARKTPALPRSVRSAGRGWLPSDARLLPFATGAASLSRRLRKRGRGPW